MKSLSGIQSREQWCPGGVLSLTTVHVSPGHSSPAAVISYDVPAKPTSLSFKPRLVSGRTHTFLVTLQPSVWPTAPFNQHTVERGTSVLTCPFLLSSGARTNPAPGAVCRPDPRDQQHISPWLSPWFQNAGLSSFLRVTHPLSCITSGPLTPHAFC